MEIDSKLRKALQDTLPDWYVAEDCVHLHQTINILTTNPELASKWAAVFAARSRHLFVGRLDRVCEMPGCGLPDRAAVHIW